MTNREFAKLIYQYIRPYRFHYMAILIAMTYVGSYISLEPYLLKMIIDKVTHHQGPNLFFSVVPYIAYFALGGIIYSLSWQVKHVVERSVIPYVETNIAMHLFKYLQKQSHRYFQEKMPGTLSTKIADLQLGVERILAILMHFFRMTVGVCVTIFFMAKVHLYFAMVVVVWIIMFLFVTSIIASRLEVQVLNRAYSRSATFGRIVDSLANIMTIRLFGKQDYEIQKQYESFDVYVNQDRNLRYQQILMWVFLGGFALILQITMLLLLVYGAQNGWVVMSDFAFVMLTSISLIEKMFFIMELISEFSTRWGTAKQGASLMSDPLEIEDKYADQDFCVRRGAIEFQNVNFSYNKKPVLKNLSIKFFGGEKVGLVGFSGGGKTTFINLISRLFDPDSGSVLIDGNDITKVSQKSLRSAIAYIPQDPVLFNRSILSNLRYGKLNATKEEIQEACKMAHCHEFIERLPEKYETIVGERGAKLSGGQRQRIAIARAYLKDAPILLMDEATSALDSATEKLIQESMESLMEEKTVIVIAHRLSTLLSMDRIVVFDQGQIVEEGTHNTLMKKKGLYEKLWKAQQKGFIGDTKKMKGKKK
ncbi:MAG: ABC transporter ATP-binding protein [Alphaproteobacteria bacterium]|nr:MAG: ABC transporter ATP-binding protein [Alphaproteobacteria bacterium]